MRHFGLLLASVLGLAATVVPASADIATYTLNCDSVACGSPTTYGTVKLDDHSGSGTVTVTMTLSPNTFAGTGAGYAITWNVLRDPLHPALTTTLSPTNIPNPSDPSHPLYNKNDFAVMDHTDGSTTYSASPFGGGWEYAIDYSVSGGRSTNDQILIFDVTRAAGLAVSDFIANNGFMFTADIWQSPGGPTFVVAAKVLPEPATWLMFFSALMGLTLYQRRRKLARAN